MTQTTLRVRFRRLLIPALIVGTALASKNAGAQTDYYNTDAGRPLQIEDAYATERYAFELKLTSLKLERAPHGRYNLGMEPEIAYGLLPRTHIEIGLPIAHQDLGDGASRSGVAGLELSAMHNLNTETRSLPALGIRGDLLFPVGGLGPDRTLASLKGMATRTFSAVRFHLNGQYTFGDGPDTDAGAEGARWLGGIAVDKALPLKSILFAADLYARQPLHESEDVDYNTNIGFRYQTSPSFLLDAGLGRRLTGPERGWSLTFGTAYAFALRSLIPVRVSR